MSKECNTEILQTIQTLKAQVSNDLKKKLNEYRDPKVGVRLLASKMEVSERTLSRLINQENRPTYQTLIKIYKVIFNTTNNSMLMDLVPSVVRSEIIKHNPDVTTSSNKFSSDFESELLYDRCFSEIYIMAGCAPLSRELVQYRFGMHGMETLERMVELKALKLSNDGSYVLGDNQINLSAKTLKRLGLSISEKYSKPQNSEVGGENLIGFFAEGLSDEAYDEWLKVDERAFKEKIRISQSDGAKGSKRAFTFMVTDTLTDK